jgi:hypothetical protein
MGVDELGELGGFQRAELSLGDSREQGAGGAGKIGDAFDLRQLEGDRPATPGRSRAV